MSDFRTYVTQTGFGLERDAKFNNTHVDFAVLVVGDGVLPDSASPAAQTDLIHQVREYAITIEKDEKDPNVWIARAEIPASDGGFFIKEAGIKTKGKALYAYARQAGDYKPLLEEGQGKSYTIRLKFVPGNADAIQIKIDPSVQFATPTDLNDAMSSHVKDLDPHPQYLKKSVADARRFSVRSFIVLGDENDIVLISKDGDTAVNALSDYDEFSFIVAATNTSAVTIKIDELVAIPLTGVVSDTQLFETALLTVRYIAGSFYIVEQINPQNGNNVADILKLIVDTTDVLYPGEYALDGSTINSSDHPIGCAIAAASSNYIDQASKDAEPIKYGGYYGFVDELDGSTTVTLPMMGGEFIRLFDDGRGVDSGRGFGSHKMDALQGHYHNWVGTITDNTGGKGGIIDGPDIKGGSTFENKMITNITTDPVYGVARVDIETRPRSIAYYGKTRL